MTSVKIEGVLHEFSTIPGVCEDVTDIILNLKDLLVRLHGDTPRVIRLHKREPAALTCWPPTSRPTQTSRSST